MLFDWTDLACSRHAAGAAAHSWDNLAGPDVHQDEYCDPPCEHMDADELC